MNSLFSYTYYIADEEEEDNRASGGLYTRPLILFCNLTMNPKNAFFAPVSVSANKSIYSYTFCLTCSRETCLAMEGRGDRKAWEVFLHFRLTFGHSQVTSTITSYDDDEHELVWYAWETCKL